MKNRELTMGKELDLKAEQAKTLERPVMKANIILRSMYFTMDLLYGFKRTLPKFRVIELLARYPYWAWERGGYLKISHAYAKTKHVKKPVSDAALHLIDLGRKSQDNEQWHLFLIDDIMKQKGLKIGWIRGSLMPELMMLSYHILSSLMYRLKPDWSFAMNARFESHAEHQYMLLVQDNPEWDDEPIESVHFEHYPRQASLGDLFRRIGLDERDHMNESLNEYERLTGKALD